LDADLARLYGVSTKRLNEQVKRNQDRFPEDFKLQLTAEEDAALRSQIATSKPGRGGRRYRPRVFTEHGAMMRASVVNSEIAVRVSIAIVRAFIHLRAMPATHKDLARKLETLEKKYDAQSRLFSTRSASSCSRRWTSPRDGLGFGWEMRCPTPTNEMEPNHGLPHDKWTSS
jgi:hypothetical protein